MSAPLLPTTAPSATSGATPEALHAELRALIAASRQRVAGAVNAELTRLHWTLGERRGREVLGGERAAIAQAHAGGAGGAGELAALAPATVFKDPYFLDFLGLHDGHSEADLESAILRELESFILELGRGFAFVERQKRMVIDGEDFYLDLLFFHRRLRRLVAVELKLGRFKAAHKGQMELYLSWLNRYERQPGEAAPLGLILCAESSREQVELLQTEKDGITVAEYWTQLLPKAEMEARLHQMLVEARERLARRGVLLGNNDEE